MFGAFLDSSFDRVGEAVMLAAIGLAFMHDGNEWGVVVASLAVGGSFLVSYTRAKAEALGLRGDVGFGSRVERVVLISVGLGLAPVGLARVADLRARGGRLDHGRPAHPVRAAPAPRAGAELRLTPSAERGEHLCLDLARGRARAGRAAA